MAVDQPGHRPGLLKQTNKTHKTGKHRSKGAIDNALKGKVSAKVLTRKHKEQQRREERRNQSNQVRKNKREEVFAKKRQLGGNTAAPFLVCLLPLHQGINANIALSILGYCDSEAIINRSLSGITYITIPRFKQRFAFIIPPIGHGNELTVLDYLKVCDTTILLTSVHFGEDQIMDRWGHKIFNMISAQGIPSPILTVMDLLSLVEKRRAQAKAAVQKFFAKLLPDQQVMQFGLNSEALNILRRIGGQKKNILYNKANRPHLFGEKVEYVPNTVGVDGALKVTGFLRGKPLDVNGLVHVPGLGDFQLNQIDEIKDPYKIDKEKYGGASTSSNECRVFAKADPRKQATLQRENIPDDMDAEQTWPTEEEIALANAETRKTRYYKKVPKGMSDYQACWIPDVEEVDAEDDTDSADDRSDNEDFMSCGSKNNTDDEMDQPKSERDEEFDTVTVSEAPVNDEKYDLAMDLQEERETLRKIKEARVDQMWPDEIDTPNDVPARERFQKYRGLESFRTSPWDPKENLPSDYARIYQFQNFDRTKRRIIKEAADIDGALPGSYLTLHIANVSLDKWTAFKSALQTENLVVYGILPHENQMSVVNVVLKRTTDSEVPLESKERLIVQCGYRRFIVNPIFSQHTNAEKHKYERYFRPHTTVVATFFAPIQFPPVPVLCFKENPDTSLALMARGCLLSCNPDRIVLKRVVLSGHPFKINRKSATVRYMFKNKEDVEFFKPVKLRTKCGRLGHIKESLGTHGHMKCAFDGQMKSFDTIFLCLYKRVFPKWTYEDLIVECKDDTKMQD